MHRVMNAWCKPLKKNPVVFHGLEIRLIDNWIKKSFKWSLFYLLIIIFIAYDLSERHEPNEIYRSCECLCLALSVKALTFNLTEFVFRCRQRQTVGCTEAQAALLYLSYSDNEDEPTRREVVDDEPNVDNDLMPPEALAIIRERFPSIQCLCMWRNLRNINNADVPSDQCVNRMQHNLHWRSRLDSGTFRSSTNEGSSRKHQNDVIMDEQSLRQYLNKVKTKEPSVRKKNPYEVLIKMRRMAAEKAKRNDLRKTRYQLSPAVEEPSMDCDVPPFSVDNSQLLINVWNMDKVVVSVWKLRQWISLTILRRLVEQIDLVDRALNNYCNTTQGIGQIGLGPLMRMAEDNEFYRVYVPVLPMVLPYLVLSEDQSYLVERIKWLSRGTGLAGYVWNGGGPGWCPHRPTDAAIIFHLFCSYMDQQMQIYPGGYDRPFFNKYVITSETANDWIQKDDDSSASDDNKFAIICDDIGKPILKFISNGEIHEFAGNKNINLFKAIMQFFIHVRDNCDGCFEGINLGPCGWNILGVIED